MIMEEAVGKGVVVLVHYIRVGQGVVMHKPTTTQDPIILGSDSLQGRRQWDELLHKHLLCPAPLFLVSMAPNSILH